MAESLWNTSDIAPWQSALDGYRSTVIELGPEIAELDRWFHEDLPPLIAARGEDAYLTQKEIAKVVEWKMKRNKPRPRLQKFADELDDAAVQAATRGGLAALRAGRGSNGAMGSSLQAIQQAVTAIEKPLKGIGPATASAVLEAADPSVPFMSEEAMAAALTSKGYKVKECLELTEALRAKAAALSEAGQRQWTAREVENALWAAARAGGGSGSGRKRKR